MADLDALLTPEAAARAADAAAPPPYEALLRRGRSRRRATRAAVSFAVVVAVAVGLVGATALDGDHRADPQPVAPTGTPSPSQSHRSGPTADQIVDDPNAFVRQVVTLRDDPDARAVVWGLCSGAGCRSSYTAVAVTTDGFATRSVLRVGRNESSYLNAPTSQGQRSFLVTGADRPYLLGLDGSVQPVGRPGVEAPRGADEAVTRWYGPGGAGFIAVDTGTGTSHYLPHPAGAESIEVTPDGDLQGIVRDAKGACRVVWSQDGGATWQSHDLVPSGGDLFTNVPSAAPGLRAVIGGGDGATLFPFDEVWRGQAGGSWEAFAQDRDPTAYIGVSVVLPDRRLVVDVSAWSDARAGKPGSRPRGPYVSAGDEWSRTERLVPATDSGLAADERQRVLDGELELRGVSVGRHATLYVGPIGRSDVVYAVADGRAWSRLRVR